MNYTHILQVFPKISNAELYQNFRKILNNTYEVIEPYLYYTDSINATWVVRVVAVTPSI